MLALKASAASAAAAERPKEDVHWSHGSPHSQAAAAATAADSKGLASYAHIQNVRLLETERPKSLVVVKKRNKNRNEVIKKSLIESEVCFLGSG